MSVITDIATFLAANGVGTLGTDLFYSYLPGELDAGVAVIDTGGLAPEEDIPTKEPTFQVFVRSTSYTLGKAKLDLIRSLLHRTINTTIGSTYFYFILAIAEGGHLGREDAGRDTFSINFRARTR